MSHRIGKRTGTKAALSMTKAPTQIHRLIAFSSSDNAVILWWTGAVNQHVRLGKVVRLWGPTTCWLGMNCTRLACQFPSALVSANSLKSRREQRAPRLDKLVVIRSELWLLLKWKAMSARDLGSTASLFGERSLHLRKGGCSIQTTTAFVQITITLYRLRYFLVTIQFFF